MQETFKLEGMTCQGCADTIQNGLNEQSFIDKAIVSLEENSLVINAKQNLDINSLNSIVSGLGNYKVRPFKTNLIAQIINYFTSKKPIVIALLIVILSSLAMQISAEEFLTLAAAHWQQQPPRLRRTHWFHFPLPLSFDSEIHGHRAVFLAGDFAQARTKSDERVPPHPPPPSSGWHRGRGSGDRKGASADWRRARVPGVPHAPSRHAPARTRPRAPPRNRMPPH